MICAIGSVPSTVTPEELAQLPGDHDDRDAGEVADEHRTAEQLGDEPHAQEAGDQARTPTTRAHIAAIAA